MVMLINDGEWCTNTMRPMLRVHR